MTADYKSTLHLPRTGFSMKAGLAQKEPEILAKWAASDLYGQVRASRADAPPFVLHDGPPYANAHLHHGHILNKILKDVVVKDRTMAGFDVAYVPGWDCHGLPIEVQVDKQLGAKKAELSRAQVRAKCREHAASFVAIQRQEFQRLGVLGRWDDPYLTMSPAYEAQTVRELARFVDGGLLYKGLRPVNWCMFHQTALAEAEVEYDEHRSPSIYVAFPFTEGPQVVHGAEVVIWTTTPWTLPANLAVSVHPGVDYVVYPVRGRPCVFARALADSFLAAVGEPAFASAKVVAQLPGRELEGAQYRHVLTGRQAPIVLGEHVTVDTGTGCVHTAPGHGADDFEVGKRYGLGVLSPVDDRGVFTEAAGPYAGRHVFSANADIIAELQRVGALLSPPDATLAHRYPHCWRCQRPIILRATEQWFVAIDKPFAGGDSLRQRALAALDEVTWIPSWGRERILGMLKARPDWCLSRQRAWGVPIAVFYCRDCNTPLVSASVMNRVADVFAREGSDVWFTHSVSHLAGDLRCGSCGGSSWRKDEDILDVWFDSGVSYAAVIEREGIGHGEGSPVDLYLEGSDQHRGWFHSSLLCSLATRGRAPYRSVLTHGFVVDGQGKKLSKSKGNFVDPFKTIGQSGAEILRFWVAGEDYREDVRLSQEILTRQADGYRKLRNTIRYLLGNLFDFDPSTDLVLWEALPALDRYMLARLGEVAGKVREGYASYQFHLVVQRLVELCTVDLSAFYLDVCKDRVYASGKSSRDRRAAQTAMYLIVRDVLRLMAPVLCFTAEEAWACLPKLSGDPDSVHLSHYPGVAEPDAVRVLQERAGSEATSLMERFSFLREVRKVVNSALEMARQARRLGSSVQALVTLEAPAPALARLQEAGCQELADLFIVSAVVLRAGDALAVSVDLAPGTKCARCWLYRQSVGENPTHPGVCARCAEVL